MKIRKTERGWGGHFICANRCLFRRNTLLELGEKRIVVSTVGNMISYLNPDGPPEEIGHKRYYETMAFESDKNDAKYHDANVKRQINFNTQWSISSLDQDNEANAMHEAVIIEISQEMLSGNLGCGH